MSRPPPLPDPIEPGLMRPKRPQAAGTVCSGLRRYLVMRTAATSAAAAVLAGAGWFAVHSELQLSAQAALIDRLQAQSSTQAAQNAALSQQLQAARSAQAARAEPVVPAVPPAAILELRRTTAALALARADRQAARQQLAAQSAKMALLTDSLSDVTADLLATKTRFRSWMKQHYDQLRGVLTRSGVAADPMVKILDAQGPGAGGPLVTELAPSGRSHPGDLVALPLGLRADVHAVDLMTALLAAMPLGVPAPGADIHSGFGVRHDPFTGGLAMHTGLDFSPGPSGRAYATAPGMVVYAGPEAAYGKMVEIAHRFGLSTRYAHLVRIDVRVGQTVLPGTEVGIVGSTGRSTGRHLHYEVRVNGTAVDPADFLEARTRLNHVVSQE